MRFDVSILMLKSVEHYLWAGTGHGPYALIIFLLVIRRIYNYLKKFHYLIHVVIPYPRTVGIQLLTEQIQRLIVQIV